MKRAFGFLFAVMLGLAIPTGNVMAQTTTQQVQQKAGSVGAATQQTVEHPRQHTKRWIAIGIVVLLVVLVLVALSRRRKRETIIRTRLG